MDTCYLDPLLCFLCLLFKTAPRYCEFTLTCPTELGFHKRFDKGLANPRQNPVSHTELSQYRKKSHTRRHEYAVHPVTHLLFWDTVMPTQPEAWEYERMWWGAEKNEKRGSYLYTVKAQVWFPPCSTHWRTARDHHRCMPPPSVTLDYESQGPKRWDLRGCRAPHSLVSFEMPRQRTQKGIFSWSNTRFVFYVIQTIM